jgi:hypothetical protein
MGLINQAGIIDGQVVYAEHVLRIINALSAINNNDILITGNLQNTGSFTVYGTASFYGDSVQISSSVFVHTSSITNNDTYSRVLVQDPGTGKIFFRNSNTLSGSSGTVTGSVWSIGGNSFTSSIDEIFGSFSNNNILFYVSGSEIMRITSGSAKIGINNSAPTALLHIKGRGTTISSSLQVDDNSSAVLFKILDNGSVFFKGSITGSVVSASFTGSLLGTSSIAFISNTASFYQETDPIFNNNSSSYLPNSKTGSFATTGSNIFNGNQNIIGSITASIMSASFTGSFFGTSSWAISSSQADSASYINSNFVSNSFWVIGGNTFSGSAANPRILGSLNSYNVGLYSSGSLVLIVSTGSRIGIGTANPSAKVHITGVGTTTGQSLLVEDNSLNARFVVLDTGSVGINTSTPTALFHVKGKTGGGFDEVVRFETSTLSGSFKIYDTGSISITSSLIDISFQTFGLGSPSFIKMLPSGSNFPAIILNSGAAAKYSMQFNGDDKAYWSFVSTGEVRHWVNTGGYFQTFYSNALETMRLVNGLVGIGKTSNINSRLDVFGNFLNSGSIIVSGSLAIGVLNTSSISFFNNNSTGFGVSTSSLTSSILDLTKTYWGFTGSAAAIWTLPSMSSTVGISYKIYNRGSGSAATLTLTGSSVTDKLFTTTTASSLLINPGEKYEAYNDGTYWILFTL